MSPLDSAERELLREAARDALSGHQTLPAARAALDGAALPDLWPTAQRAGWPGLLVAERHGGAGLGGTEALLVAWELGRVLAGVPLIGHLPATVALQAAGEEEFDGLLRRLAAGEARAAFVAAPTPPGAGLQADQHGRISGEADWVIDAPGADVLVVEVAAADVPVGETSGARRHTEAFLIEADHAHVTPITGYDASRSLGHVRLDAAPARRLRTPAPALARTGDLQQALLGAEALGSVERLLEMSVEHSLTRHAFGRRIGSYQAIKHQLSEVLRRLENGRSLLAYADWAQGRETGEYRLASSALRCVAGDALDHAARTAIAVHGGLGATWEHDAQLYFRRAQLTRRLLGGQAGAADRVADELLTRARAASANAQTAGPSEDPAMESGPKL